MVLCVLLGLSFSFLVVSFSISDWARLALKQLVSVSSEMLLIFQVSKFGANDTTSNEQIGLGIIGCRFSYPSVRI